jgi:hypothetical protein
MGEPYGFASCGCPNSHMGTDHVNGCIGTASRPVWPDQPKPPPPIGPASRVRLKPGVHGTRGLLSSRVYTVERFEAVL